MYQNHIIRNNLLCPTLNVIPEQRNFRFTWRTKWGRWGLHGDIDICKDIDWGVWVRWLTDWFCLWDRWNKVRNIQNEYVRTYNRSFICSAWLLSFETRDSRNRHHRRYIYTHIYICHICIYYVRTYVHVYVHLRDGSTLVYALHPEVN